MSPQPAWFEAGFPHIWTPYSQMKTAAPPLPVARTEGVRIHLADGRVLIDGIASWWTACHGYNHPHIRAAMLPGDLNRVFFTDSGSVAVEVAMKMAMQLWLNRGMRDRTGFLAFRGGYHGDTLGTMAVCDPGEGMHSIFTGLLPPPPMLDLPTDAASIAAFDRFLDENAKTLAAIIVAPLLQGAGGMIFHDAEVLRRLRTAADRHGLVLIFDEIFTGFGRTGTMFAYEAAGVVPDIITLSKALTGGTMALAATVASDAIFDGFWSDDPGHALMHGPTYMANALACSAANASLDLFEREPRLAQVAAGEGALRAGLEPCADMPNVRDVRVMGAIGVVELERIDDVDALRARFVAEGVFVRPFGNIVYLTPAFTIPPDELAALTDAVVKVVGTMRPSAAR